MNYNKQMSYKRRRSSYGASLTGGSGDVNPQFMNLTATQSAADTYTQVTFPIPIQRLQNSGRAQVMEILKIFAESSALTAVAAGATNHRISVQMTTKSFAAEVTLSEPTCFFRYQKDNINAFTAAGTGGLYQEFEPNIQDLTDGAGHGMLVASDNIFLAVSSLATGSANRVDIKILYRWKDVSIQEYVGIVQSQQ